MIERIDSVSKVTLQDMNELPIGFYKAYVMKDGSRWEGLTSYKNTLPQIVVLSYYNKKFTLVWKEKLMYFTWDELLGNIASLERVE